MRSIEIASLFVAALSAPVAFAETGAGNIRVGNVANVHGRAGGPSVNVAGNATAKGTDVNVAGRTTALRGEVRGYQREGCRHYFRPVMVPLAARGRCCSS